VQVCVSSAERVEDETSERVKESNSYHKEERGKKQGNGKITRGAGRITAMKERRGKERMSM